MKNIVVMGESMVEMAPIGNACYKQSFAGDVYNTAVYLKRILKADAKVSILTAVGEDLLSDKMVSHIKQEQIETDFVFRDKQRQIGAYLIETSVDGERSFIYWRDTSAARDMLSTLNDNDMAQLITQLINGVDIFYFTGISLAILEAENKPLFWRLLSKLKNAGVRIIFDSNYRPKLWQNEQDVIKQFEQAFYYSDLVFSGVEDFQQLLKIDQYDEIVNYLKSFNIDELVIKNGDQPMLSIQGGDYQYQTVEKVSKVVDSTSAGDSFNAAYIAARQYGHPCQYAMKYGSMLAAEVIQHKGAIIDRAICEKFLESQGLSRSEDNVE